MDPWPFFRFNGPFCLGEKSAAPKVATGAGWGAAHPGPAQPRPPGRCRPRGSSETMGNIWEIIGKCGNIHEHQRNMQGKKQYKWMFTAWKSSINLRCSIDFQLPCLITSWYSSMGTLSNPPTTRLGSSQQLEGSCHDPYNVGPPSDVCWFINPMNTIVICVP